MALAICMLQQAMLRVYEILQDLLHCRHCPQHPHRVSPLHPGAKVVLGHPPNFHLLDELFWQKIRLVNYL